MRRAHPPLRLPARHGLTMAFVRLFREFVDEYGIDDVGGVQILVSGLRSLQSAERAEKLIDKQGLVFVDRWGQKRSHPLIPAARDHRAAWLSALRALNLEVGTPPKPGRPREDG